MPKKEKATYKDLTQELNALMAELQREDIDVDKALVCFQRGQTIITELEAYLKTAENKLTITKTTL